MAGTDRDAVLAWVAGQLNWERRLRELEAAPAPSGEQSEEQPEPGWTLPERAPMVPAWPSRRATPRPSRPRRHPA